MKTMIGINAKLVLLLLALGLTVGGGYAGYGAWVGQPSPPRAQEKQPPVAHGDSVKKDAPGDPLPPDAIARLGTLRWLHDGPVLFAAFLPDGKQVVTTSNDGTIRLWEYPAGNEIRRIPMPAGSVGGMLALSTDGKTIATAKLDETEIYLHDLATGKQLPVLKWALSEEKAQALDKPRFAFSPNGEHLAALDRDGAVSIWDWAKGKEIRKFGTSEGLRGPALAYAPDGKSILTINNNKAGKKDGVGNPFSVAKIWDPATGKEKCTIEDLGRLDVIAVSFSPNSKSLAISGDRGIVIVDTATGKQIRAVTTQPHFASKLVFGKDGAKLYNRSFNTIVEYDVDTGELLRQHQLQMRSNAPISLSPDGNTLVTPAVDRLHFFDLSGKEIADLNDDSNPPSFLQYTPDGKTVLTGPPTQKWNAATGKALGRLDPLSAPGYRSVYSPDAKILVRRVEAPGGKDTFILIAADSGKEMGQLTVQAGGIRWVGEGPTAQWGLRFAPNSKSFAVFQPKKRGIELYDAATAKLLRSFDVVPDLPKVGSGPRLISHMVFSADGKTVAFHARSPAVSSLATPLILFDTASGKQIGSLPLPPSKSPAFSSSLVDEGVVFSPDGRCLALDLNDGTVVFHELATGKPRSTFGKPSKGQRLCFAFSSDGRSLLYGGPDGSVHLCDIVTGAELAKFTGHTGSVNAVAFSPLGKTVASVGDDCTGLIWDISKLKRPELPTEALKPGELDNHWQTLAESDAAKAWAAMRDLIAAPKDAVALIKARVKPAGPLDGKRIADLIAQLDDQPFEVRDKAINELVQIDERLVAALDKALAANPSLETRRRLQDLRGKVTGPLLQGERLRGYRAVEVLEQIGTPEARAVLQALAGGAPGARITTSAQAGLKR